MSNLNLEFSGNTLRVLQLNETRDIIIKDERKLSFNILNEQTLKSKSADLISEFAVIIKSVLNDDSNEQRAGVLISTEQTFLNVFPVDFNEDQSSINSHILWELSNYYPETYKDFNIKYYRLNNNYFNENIDEALLIAIDKNAIGFIKVLCNGSNIKIRNVEIDQFAVEKCVKENYPEEIKNTILIIGCKNNRLDFSVIARGYLKYYDYEIFEGKKFRNLLIRHLNIYNKGYSKIEKIFLYGDENTEHVKKFLDEMMENKKVSFIKYNEGNNDSRFSALYGLALKNTG
ncbi:MAG: pilus assembly protein PilM [Bacteroidota bacterium]|nr:pilus assembly protein PilM [Bacteroidota bacterium]